MFINLHLLEERGACYEEFYKLLQHTPGYEDMPTPSSFDKPDLGIAHDSFADLSEELQEEIFDGLTFEDEWIPINNGIAEVLLSNLGWVLAQFDNEKCMDPLFFLRWDPKLACSEGRMTILLQRLVKIVSNDCRRLHYALSDMGIYEQNEISLYAAWRVIVYLNRRLQLRGQTSQEQINLKGLAYLHSPARHIPADKKQAMVELLVEPK